MKFLPFIFKSLLRKKSRTLLTVSSIVLPLFIMCWMGTLLDSMTRDRTAETGLYRIVVRHKVSLVFDVPMSYEEKIAQIPGVLGTNIRNWFGGKYIDNNPENFFARFYVDPTTFFKMSPELKMVQGTEQEWIQQRDGIIVGESMFKKYQWKMGQKIVFVGDIYPGTYEFTLVGVYKGPEENAAYFHHKMVAEKLAWVAGRAGVIWVKTDSSENVARIGKAIDAMFENSPEPTLSESESEFRAGFVNMLGNVTYFFQALCLMIVLVILLITANSIAMSARERVTEIAVLRTLGFQKSTVLYMVMAESVLLSMLGGFLGLALFYGSFAPLKTILMDSPMAGFATGMRLNLELLIQAILISFSIGILSGLVPAVRSAKRSIVDGLRYIG